MPKYALLSVYNKVGILDFAKGLVSLGYSLISTGGTAKILTQAQIKVTPIQEITGNPESFDGRIKTISFQIEAGILFDRKNPDHLKQAKELNILPIDIVVCNLYPFESSPTIENIDVGGPTMLRSAAKNYSNVLSICHPEDYQLVLSVLKNPKQPIVIPSASEGSVSTNSSLTLRMRPPASSFGMTAQEFRFYLAQKTFEHLSFYDSQIAQYFRVKSQESRIKEGISGDLTLATNHFPKEITIPGRKVSNLRWGDNPHQKASLYLRPGVVSPFTNLKKLTGRDLSGTNLTDLSVGIEAVRLFKNSAATIIKHNTPCGIALGKNASEALQRAIESDPESAFGGTIVINRPLDQKCVKVISDFKAAGRGVFDIIAGTEVPQQVADELSKVRKTLGVYSLGKLDLPQKQDISFKEIVGGFMLQESDWNFEDNFKNWQVVTKATPSHFQMEQMKVAWTMIRRIRSNAVIVVDKNLPMTRGIGTGQTSRFRAAKIALDLAKDHTRGAILASDSFFPFDDSVKLAAKYDISCVIQQGGSIKDEDSIKAADEAGLVMVMTGERLFWHY